MKKNLTKIFQLALIYALMMGIIPANAQTDPSLLFAKGIGNEYFGGGDLMVSYIKIDASGNRYVAGYFRNTADFDPGAGTANLTSVGGSDIFFAKYNASGNYLWANAIGGTDDDEGISLALDGSGNVVVTGYFQNTADFDPGAGTANLTSVGGNDIFLAKYNASGNYLWANAIGGTSSDRGNSIALDGSGNVVLTGYFNGTVDFDPSASTANLTNAGQIDIFLAKYNASGNYVWAKGMGGTGADWGNFLALDGSGNVVVTGYFEGSADFDPSTTATSTVSAWGSSDIFLAKYDASGNYVWAKNIGGGYGESCTSLALDVSGNVVVTGYFNQSADFDPSSAFANLISAGGTDIFLAKYDASGNYVWAKKIGGTNYDQGKSLTIDGSGNVFITGSFVGTVDFDPSSTSTANLTNAGDNRDIFLAKFDASGNYVWAQAMGGTVNDDGTSLALDGSGNVVVTGNFNGTADFDPGSSTVNLVSGTVPNFNGFIASYTAASGNYNSASVLGKYNAATVCVSNSIVKDGSGNVFITGYFYGTVDFDPSSSVANLISAGGSDIFVAKYNASGNYVWAKAIGGTSDDKSNSLVLDGSGNLVVLGSFNGTVDFDPSSSAANLTSAGGTDIFLAKFDASGNYVWAKNMGGYGYEDGKSLVLDGSGNLLITGSFNSTADFDPGSGIANLVAVFYGADIFLAKYDASGNYVWAKAMGGTGFSKAGNSLALDGSGNVVVTGYFSGTVDFDPGSGIANLVSVSPYNADIFLAKYDASGNYVWANAMGGTGFQKVGNSLALDGTGNVVVTGYFSGTVDFDPGSGTANLTDLGNQGMFLAKYDASGNYVWANAIGGIMGLASGNALALDGSGNVIVTGYFSGTNIDFDPSSSTVILTAGIRDMFLAKYNASGNYIWAKAMDGNSYNNSGNSLALDGSGNVVVTGTFMGTVDFDPSAGTTNLTSMSGDQYGFIAAYLLNCTNPTLGGTIAAAQSGTNPFNPAAFTSTVAASGESGTLEYKWQSSTTSNSAGFSDIASSNAATYDAGALTQTTWFKRLARVTCLADWSSAVASNILEVTVITCTPTSYTATISACDSYLWHGTTYTASNNTATWTGVNAGGCDSVVTLNLTINATPSTPTVNVVNNCNGTSTLSTTVSGTLLWSTTATASPITVSNAGTYTVTQTVNGCVSASGSGITAPKTTNTGDTTASVCGSFVWYGVTYNASATPTHTYTNVSGCDSVVTLHLIINALPLSPAATLLQPNCNTGGTITVSNVLSGSSYSIDGYNYTSTGVFSNLAPGTYSLTAKNAAGCISAATAVTLNEPTGVPPAATLSVMHPSCASAYGTIRVTSTVFFNSFSIDRTNFSNLTGVFSGLPAGTYNVWVKNAAGCISAPSTVVVNAQPSTPAAPVVTLTQPSCTVSTGTIYVNNYLDNLYYSTNSFTYLNNTGILTGMVSGNYNLTAKNAAGCISPATAVVINARLTIPTTPSATVSQPTCAVSTGNITVSSPSAAYTYSITRSGQTIGSLNGFFSGVASGSYSLVAISNAGCGSSAKSVVVNAQPATPAAPALSVTQSTTSVATGTIKVTSTVMGNSFSINGSGFTNLSGVFSGLSANIYSITAKSSAGCISSPSTVNIGSTTTTYTRGTETPTPVVMSVLPIVPAAMASDLFEVGAYPNPTNSDFKLNISSASSETIRVTLYDMFGRAVKYFSFASKPFITLGQDLKAGVYMVELRQGKNVKSLKVVKF